MADPFEDEIKRARQVRDWVKADISDIMTSLSHTIEADERSRLRKALAIKNKHLAATKGKITGLRVGQKIANAQRREIHGAADKRIALNVAAADRRAARMQRAIERQNSTAAALRRWAIDQVGEENEAEVNSVISEAERDFDTWKPAKGREGETDD